MWHLRHFGCKKRDCINYRLFSYLKWGNPVGSHNERSCREKE
jgi:hypothetical protein